MQYKTVAKGRINKNKGMPSKIIFFLNLMLLVGNVGGMITKWGKLYTKWYMHENK